MRYKKCSLYQFLISVGLVKLSRQYCESLHTNSTNCIERNYDGSCFSAVFSKRNIVQCRSLTWTDFHLWSTSTDVYVQDSNITNMDWFRDGGLFPNIQILSITKCELSRVVDYSFNMLRGLRFLNLSSNNIESVSPAAFATLFELTLLDLSYNSILRIESDVFMHVPKLEFLFLRHNKILNIHWSHLQQLKFLDISYNRMQTFEFNENFAKIMFINLRSNDLVTFSERTVCPSIIFLDISDNNLNKIVLESYSQLVNLTKLNLSRNPIFVKNDVPCFHHLPSLQLLNLSSTSIRKLNVGIFSQLHLLEVLDISWNNLTYLPKQIFHGLTHLRRLDISNNYLVYLDYDEYSSLHEINLNNNLFECDTLSAILRKLDNVKVNSENAYNTTNIAGIACQGNINVFENSSTYNSSEFNNLQKKYLAQMINSQINMENTFVELEDVVNITTRNLLNQESNVQNSLIALENIIELLKNVTNIITTKTNGEDIKQVINLQNTIADLIRRDDYVKSWKKIETIQNDLRKILVEIKEDISSNSYEIHTKASEVQLSSTNIGETIALYCIFGTLLTILVISLFVIYKKYKCVEIPKYRDHPLNSLEM